MGVGAATGAGARHRGGPPAGPCRLALLGRLHALVHRSGTRVEAEIDLKDRVWRGTGESADEGEAAWRAVQDCIGSWRADTATDLTPHVLRRWRARRR